MCSRIHQFIAKILSALPQTSTISLATQTLGNKACNNSLQHTSAIVFAESSIFQGQSPANETSNESFTTHLFALAGPMLDQGHKMEEVSILKDSRFCSSLVGLRAKDGAPIQRNTDNSPIACPR